MIPVTQEKIKYLFDTAKKYKEDVKSELNECFELADIYFKIEDSLDKKTNKSRDIDYSIIASRKFLANFTMSSIFNKNNAWAKMQVNEASELAKSTNKNISVEQFQDINKKLEENSNTTFAYIKNSNYYTEISKAIKMAQFGTGIYKINVQKSDDKPFSFEYLGYENVYFTEDALGKPAIVFKTHYPMNYEEMVDRFSGSFKSFTPPSDLSEGDPKTKVEVIECQIGMLNEETGKYEYYNCVYSKGFDTLLAAETKTYPTFFVFRWEVEGANPWGTGPARDNRELFKSLKDDKEKLARILEKNIDPPLMYYGNIELAYKIRLDAGYINWGGAGTNGNNVGVQQLPVVANTMNLEQQIEEKRAAIQRAFLYQPLGDVRDSQKTATEQSLRIELFNKEWATTGEMINTEVLYPTFTACYEILLSKNLITNSIDNSEKTTNYELVYMNELTRNTGLEDINQILNYYTYVGSVMPETERDLLIKPEQFAEYAADKMRIPKKIIPTTEELKQIIEQRKQQQLQLLMTRAGGELGNETAV